MSKYTTTLYHIVKSGFNLGLKDYPIFDENYRDTLNKEILDYYLMYEIGFETPMLFKHYLNNKMQIIMPKYNIIYEAQLKLLANPVGNVDLKEELNRNITGENNGNIVSDGNNTSSSDTNTKHLFQDTPQGDISQTDINNQKYATNLNLSKGNATGTNTLHTTNTSNENRHSTEDYIKTILGSNGRKYNVEIYSKLINDFQNIDQLIINELDNLFMGVL